MVALEVPGDVTVVEWCPTNPALVAVGTAATREAENQDEFLARLQAEAQVDVRVISGPEEARLIYLGVAHGVHIGAELALYGRERTKLRSGDIAERGIGHSGDGAIRRAANDARLDPTLIGIG
jgi:hypothetical protein